MLVSSVMAPLEGKLIDRFGSRKVLLACIPASIGCLIWIGLAVTPIELGIAVTVNRVINADTYPLIGTTTLSQWFVKHRGKASVVLGLVWAVILEFPGIELKFKEWVGGSSAYFLIAAYVGILALLAGSIWKDTPESVNLLPDLARPAKEEAAEDRSDRLEKAPLDVIKGQVPAASPPSEEFFTLAQASRTVIFWAIVLMQLMQNTLWQGCHLHLLDVLSLKGVDSTSAGDFYVAVAVARTLVSLTLGFFVVDRLGRYGYVLLIIAMLPELVVALLLLGYIGPDTWKSGMAFMLGLVYGVWGGVNSLAGDVIFAQIFGRKHIGAISGLAKGAMRVSGAIGPLFFGVSRDLTGSYDLALKALMMSTILAGTTLGFASLPKVPNMQPLPGAVIGSPTEGHHDTGADTATATEKSQLATQVVDFELRK